MERDDHEPRDAARAIAETARALRERVGGALDLRSATGLVLGSGLGSIADRLREPVRIPQEELPELRRCSVSGHSGSVVVGSLDGAPAVVWCGRRHLYEGCGMEAVLQPVRVMHALGIRAVVLTSATGGIRPEHEPGDLVLVTDHLNLMGGSPLEGAFLREGPEFLDLTECYDSAWRARARRAATELAIPLREGVLAAVRGPQYETPAEIRMLRTLGADVVCMSLVPEAIAARHLGMAVLGLAIVANKAAGMSGGLISHEDVLARVGQRAADVGRLLAGTLRG